MADAADLKSAVRNGLAGSNPASATILRALSSVGQSTPLITGWSSVQARESPPLSNQEQPKMIDTLITAGYWIGAVSLILSVVGYFLFPHLIKVAFSGSSDDDTGSSEADS